MVLRDRSGERLRVVLVQQLPQTLHELRFVVDLVPGVLLARGLHLSLCVAPRLVSRTGVLIPLVLHHRKPHLIEQLAPALVK